MTPAAGSRIPPLTATMERLAADHGVKVDTAKLRHAEDEFDRKMDAMRRDLNAMMGAIK